MIKFQMFLKRKHLAYAFKCFLSSKNSFPKPFQFGHSYVLLPFVQHMTETGLKLEPHKSMCVCVCLIVFLKKP